jgi:hypothetical protein
VLPPHAHQHNTCSSHNDIRCTSRPSSHGPIDTNTRQREQAYISELSGPRGAPPMSVANKYDIRINLSNQPTRFPQRKLLLAFRGYRIRETPCSPSPRLLCMKPALQHDHDVGTRFACATGSLHACCFYATVLVQRPNVTDNRIAHSRPSLPPITSSHKPPPLYPSSAHIHQEARISFSPYYIHDQQSRSAASGPVPAIYPGPDLLAWMPHRSPGQCFCICTVRPCDERG